MATSCTWTSMVCCITKIASGTRAAVLTSSHRLSTSWVRRYRYSKTSNRLLPSLRARVVGATFHGRMNERDFAELPRGRQVLADVLRRKPARWLALDDDAADWPEDSLLISTQT